MSDYDYGPLKTYEITWMSGHVEHVQAHQIACPSGQMLDAFVGVQTATTSARFIRMHAEIDGRWTLQLQAREDDIRTIRNVTVGEPLPGGEAA